MLLYLNVSVTYLKYLNCFALARTPPTSRLAKAARYLFRYIALARLYQVLYNRVVRRSVYLVIARCFANRHFALDRCWTVVHLMCDCLTENLIRISLRVSCFIAWCFVNHCVFLVFKVSFITVVFEILPVCIPTCSHLIPMI